MGDIAERKPATTDSFLVFLVAVFSAHPSPDILTKHNIKETAGEGNTWAPLNIPEGEGSGDGYRKRNI